MASYANLRNMYHSGKVNIGDKVSVEYLTYKSPLAQRYSYAVEGMSYNFSEYKKFQTWRKLWLYLAKAQKVSSCQPPVVLVLVVKRSMVFLSCAVKDPLNNIFLLSIHGYLVTTYLRNCKSK